MPVYTFSHQLLAVLVHLAHTAVKWKTNFLILDVGDKLVNTDDTVLMKYEKKTWSKSTLTVWSDLNSPIFMLSFIRRLLSLGLVLNLNTSDMADIISSHW